MTNALTPVSHSRLQPSRGLERQRHASAIETVTTDAARRIDPTRAAHPSASRPHPAYVAAFVAQVIANDNGSHTAPLDAARAYWDMNYRLSDLPVGFLISKAV